MTISNATSTKNYELKTVISTYTADTVTTSTVIEMVQVHKGYTVVSVQLVNAALGANSTLAVGDGGSAARYVSATDTSAAGTVLTNVAAGVGYKYTGDDTIDLTVGGGSITGLVALIVTYYIDYN